MWGGCQIWWGFKRLPSEGEAHIYQLLVDNHGVNGGAGAAVATLPVRASRVRCLSQHPWELRSSLAGSPAFPTDGAAMPPKAKGVRGAEVPGRLPAPCAFPRGLPLEWVLFSPQRSAQISLASVFVPTSPTASGWQDPACRAPTCPAHSI